MFESSSWISGDRAAAANLVEGCQKILPLGLSGNWSLNDANSTAERQWSATSAPQPFGDGQGAELDGHVADNSINRLSWHCRVCLVAAVSKESRVNHKADQRACRLQISSRFTRVSNLTPPLQNSRPSATVRRTQRPAGRTPRQFAARPRCGPAGSRRYPYRRQQ